MKNNETLTDLQKENQTKLQDLKNDFETLKLLISHNGFYQTWLNSLSNFKSKKSAFNFLNKQYYNLVGVLRYTSYNAFIKVNN